jgi:PKD repeat protein
MSVDPFDVWSPVTTTWDFGDGASGSGAAVNHTYSSPGERTVTITGVDAAGNTTQTSQKITIDPAPERPGPDPDPDPGPIVAPVVSNLKQSSSRWSRWPIRAVDRQSRLPVGTTFRFQLNRAADVELAFSGIVTGRRVEARCVKPTKANRNKPRCKRYQARGTLTIAGRAGDNAYNFRGKINSHTLKPGRYRLLVTAFADGKTSAPASIGFTIAR